MTDYTDAEREFVRELFKTEDEVDERLTITFTSKTDDDGRPAA